MATNTIKNNGVAASMYYYGRDPNQPTDDDHDQKEVAIALPIIIVVLLLLRLLCFCGQKDRDQEQDAGAGAGAGDREPVEVEMAAVQAAEPPLVCTYRKADGWGEESSCGVCLADMADGEVLRVLPACMHYFHAACVGEWLRTHDTCPLCRAPLVVVVPAAAA